MNTLREAIVDLSIRIPGSAELPGLRIDERGLSQRRERAEQRLADVAPDVASSVRAVRPLRSAEVAADLAPADAWIVLLPGEPFFAYVLRLGREASRQRLGDLDALGRACNAYVGAMRNAHRGLLRDNDLPRRVADPVGGSDYPTPPPNLADLCMQTRLTFWLPLLPVLQGVRRLHLVTGAGHHDLFLEFALPSELAQLQVLRYCGLPAYQRRLSPDMQHALTPLQPGGLSFVADDSLCAQAPIPFTRLDALLPEQAGLAQRLTEKRIDLLAKETPPSTHHVLRPPLVPGLRLMLSTHGRTVGDGETRGGQVLLPAGSDKQSRWLKPHSLAAQGLSVEWLFSLSCWSARVGDSGHGDAYGAMSALQLAGLRTAIGCLAPISDFYTPLLSAFVWHGLLQGHDSATALQQAVQRLRTGHATNMQPVLQALRHGYRQLMLEILGTAQPSPDNWTPDASTRDQLLQGVVGWSLPGHWRRKLGSAADVEWLTRTVPGTRHAQERFVDACLDVLLRDPADRDAADRDEDGPVVDAIDHLCAVTVVFGRE